MARDGSRSWPLWSLRLGRHRWDRLATYNAERARGIVHTPAYDMAMAWEQEQFDREVAEERSAERPPVGKAW